MPKKLKYRTFRANGGFLVHLVPEGKYTARCGHSPESKKGHQFHRARWCVVNSPASCQKCKDVRRKADAE